MNTVDDVIKKLEFIKAQLIVDADGDLGCPIENLDWEEKNFIRTKLDEIEIALGG